MATCFTVDHPLPPSRHARPVDPCRSTETTRGSPSELVCSVIGPVRVGRRTAVVVHDHLRLPPGVDADRLSSFYTVDCPHCPDDIVRCVGLRSLRETSSTCPGSQENKRGWLRKSWRTPGRCAVDLGTDDHPETVTDSTLQTYCCNGLRHRIPPNPGPDQCRLRLRRADVTPWHGRSNGITASPTTPPTVARCGTIAG
jgi:hypothetical protein